MKRRWLAAAAVFAATSIGGSGGASAQEVEPALTIDALYALSWAGGLYRITDPVTPTVQLIGETSIPGSTGFDVDSENEIGWALDYDNADEKCHLWRIDMADGSATDRGALGSRDECLGLDLSATGVLRGVYQNDSGESILMTIDRSSGNATDGPTLHTGDDSTLRVKALASDPSTGTLYARVESVGVMTVDTATGLLSPFSAGDPGWEAMDFSCDGSKLWVKDYGHLASTTLSPVPLVESGRVDLELGNDGGEALAAACTTLPATGANVRTPLLVGVTFLFAGVAILGGRRRRVAA